jgi:hypothetical protein
MEGNIDIDAAAALVCEGGKLLRSGRSGSPAEARCLFEEALTKDYGSKVAKFALKSFLWWQPRLEKFSQVPKGPGKGAVIVDQWEGFYRFLDDIGNVDRDTLRAIRHWVCAAAMAAFDYNALDPSQNGDWALQFKLGLCCKGVGNYEDAITFLDTAAGFKRDDIALLFERADTKALAAARMGGNSDRDARLIFREAFLANPQAVRVYSMESAFFRELYHAVQERGYGGEDILEWMPVWGTLLGAFPFKCELNQAKLGMLRAQVFELENELKTAGGAGSRNLDKKLIPRLLNRYFRLVEHYDVCRHGDQARYHERAEDYEKLVNETLLKIQYIDTEGFIYRPFLKTHLF